MTSFSKQIFVSDRHHKSLLPQQSQSCSHPPPKNSLIGQYTFPISKPNHMKFDRTVKRNISDNHRDHDRILFHIPESMIISHSSHHTMLKQPGVTICNQLIKLIVNIVKHAINTVKEELYIKLLSITTYIRSQYIYVHKITQKVLCEEE